MTPPRAFNPDHPVYPEDNDSKTQILTFRKLSIGLFKISPEHSKIGNKKSNLRQAITASLFYIQATSSHRM
jgi:hypothetical protein